MTDGDTYDPPTKGLLLPTEFKPMFFQTSDLYVARLLNSTVNF